MGIKLKLFLILISFLTIPNCSGQEKKENIELRDNEISNIKKNALCQCLYETFPDSKEMQENEGSASHYLQSGKAALEVYTKTLMFLKEYLKRTEGDYINFYERSNVSIVRCIDFYESKELDLFIRKVLKEN